mgnify:CR=1 FL=1
MCINETPDIFSGTVIKRRDLQIERGVIGTFDFSVYLGHGSKLRIQFWKNGFNGNADGICCSRRQELSGGLIDASLLQDYLWTMLKQIAALPYTLIFLETPHRLLDALQDLHAVLGDRHMAAARELTKLHEELIRDTLSGLAAMTAQRVWKGEITLVLAPPAREVAEAGGT